MQSLNQMAEREQARRLFELARAAMNLCPLDVQDVRLLAKHTNTLFRVDVADGRRYVLRVCAPDGHSLRDHQIEAMWLDALIGASEIHAPQLVPDRDSESIRHVVTDDVPDGRRCMLFTWVPGSPMEDDKSLENYEKLGALIARLHRQAATMMVPKDMQPMRWDKAFYYPLDPVVVYAPSHAHLFTPAQVEVIRQAEHVVNATLAQLYASGRPHLIHGDLHPNNVHVHRGELYAFDFEDVMWGFPAQDIAASLYSARYHRDDYADVRDAFRRGYECMAVWPIESEVQLETLFAARMLMFINYRAHRGGVDMRAYVPRMMARVEAFLHDGVLV